MGQLGAAAAAWTSRQEKKQAGYDAEYKQLADEMGRVAAAAIRGSMGYEGEKMTRKEADEAYEKIYSRLRELRTLAVNRATQKGIDYWLMISALE